MFNNPWLHEKHCSAIIIPLHCIISGRVCVCVCCRICWPFLSLRYIPSSPLHQALNNWKSSTPELQFGLTIQNSFQRITLCLLEKAILNILHYSVREISRMVLGMYLVVVQELALSAEVLTVSLWGFSIFSGPHQPTVNMLVGGSVKRSVIFMCSWYPALHFCLIQGVFLPHAGFPRSTSTLIKRFL